MEANRLRATITAAKTGSSEAYQTLLDAYGRRLYGYFYRATTSRADSEDLLGEMMLRLVRRLPSYDERGRFEPWLFRIAANMVRDRIRRSKSRPSVASLSSSSLRGAIPADALPANSPSVDAGILSQEASDELQQALDKLDDATREMILLRHFGEMSFQQIADLLECPIGTVLARVHRGLRALRKHMRVEDGTK